MVKMLAGGRELREREAVSGAVRVQHSSTEQPAERTNTCIWTERKEEIEKK